MNVQNALAAAAAAHAAGAYLNDIRQGLRTFHTSFYEAPGRLNMFELHGVRVIVDYAHNPHGLAMVGDFVERLAEPDGERRPGRRIAVIATPGDRRDEDMREIGRVAARYFDEVIVREDENPRGQVKGTIAERVLQGVQEAMHNGARTRAAEVIVDEMTAMRTALERSRPGDLVVLCVDRTADVWHHLEEQRAQTIS